MNEGTTRRSFMSALALGLPATGMSPLTASGQPAQRQVAAAEQPHGACVLMPQAVEGPYYFDPKLVRSDIAEGRPGVRLTLVLKFIELGACTPIAGARVDIWHADARGVYSGYAGQGDRRDVSTKGETYLRGTQTTGADGTATFLTVFPGWYPGRTPHIHLKAFISDRAVLTGQAYFEDRLSSRIYRERAPYSERPQQDTTNESDFIFKAANKEGGGIVIAVNESPEMLTGTLLVAVDRSGEAARRTGGWNRLWRGLF